MASVMEETSENQNNDFQHLNTFLKLCIRHTFGPNAETLLKSFLRDGVQTLHELVKATKMKAVIVKKVLLSLIQHEIVIVKRDADCAKYEFKPDNVIHLVRLPKYVIRMKNQFGIEGQIITEALCQHGILTLEQLSDLSSSRLLLFRNQQLSLVNDRENKGEDQDIPQLSAIPRAKSDDNVRTEILKVIEEMKQENYITTLNDKVEGFSKASDDEALYNAEDYEGKSSKGSKKKAGKNKEAEEKKTAGKKRGRPKKGDKFTEKKQRIEQSSSSKLAHQLEEVPTEDTVQQFRVNHNRFLWDILRETITKYIADRFTPSCNLIIEALLLEQDYSWKNSPAFSLEEIYDILKKNPNTSTLRKPFIQEKLEELVSDVEPVLLETQTGNEVVYRIDIIKLVERLKLRQVKAILREKYGILGSRIFSILLKYKKMEEKEIHDFATCSKKQARAVLYLMWKEQFVYLQDVPRSSDRQPARTFYLWSVKIDLVMKSILDSLYFTWGNLRRRCFIVDEEVKPILEKIKVHETISESEKGVIEKWQISSDRLHHSLSEIENLITLFRFY